MTRNTLLAATAALALAISPAPVAAQGLPVIDAAQLLQWADQAQRMIQQYRLMETQLRSLQRTSEMHGIAGGLMGMRTPFGADAGAITGLLSGRGGGLLSGTLSSAIARNRVYENPGTDFYAQEQNRRREAIAGRQAAAEELMRQSGERVEMLEELRTRLAVVEDPGEKLDLIARIQAEQTHLANLKVQADAVDRFAQAEEASFGQRRQERIQQEVDEAVAALEAGRGARGAR